MGRLAEIADHFRRRSIALGQEGNFGDLFSYNPRLRASFAGLASLLGNPNLTFLLQGASGTGKRKIAWEFLRLENIFRNLLSLDAVGFDDVAANERTQTLTTLLLNPPTDGAHLYFFPHLETFTPRDQALLCKLLRNLDCYEQNFRVVLSCEESLVYMVQKGKILTELVNCLLPYSFAVPRLVERPEDFSFLVLQTLVALNTHTSAPPNQSALDYLATLEYPHNLNSLQDTLSQIVAHQPNPGRWSAAEIHRLTPLYRPERTDKILDFNARVRYQ